MAYNYDFYMEHKDMRRYWPLDRAFARKTAMLSKLWNNKEMPDTPEDFREYLYDRMIDTMNRAVVPAPVRGELSGLFRALIKNPATAIFIDLMRGAESEYFLRWVQDATETNVFSLEPAYGYGRDFTKHYGKIPPYDPAVAMADDAGFEYVRWCDQKMSTMMKNTGKGSKILSINCGTMPELRYFDYPKWLLETQEFICYDPSPINYQMFFDEAGVPMDNVHTYQMNLAKAIEEETRNMNSREYDLINIKGFLSYTLPMLPEIIPAVVRLLQKPGSKFGFDLQLKNWILDRNKWLFLWASNSGMNFELLGSFKEAKKLVEKIVTDANLPVDVSISQPGFSPTDTTVVFVTLTKRA